MSTTPRIPDHLLHYDEADWLPRVEPGALYPALRARQLWADAQVAWCIAHHIWSGDFERMRQQQLAEHSTSGVDGKTGKMDSDSRRSAGIVSPDRDSSLAERDAF